VQGRAVERLACFLNGRGEKCLETLETLSGRNREDVAGQELFGLIAMGTSGHIGVQRRSTGLQASGIIPMHTLQRAPLSVRSDSPDIGIHNGHFALLTAPCFPHYTLVLHSQQLGNQRRRHPVLLVEVAVAAAAIRD
jgi:hypothetical protein